uniref:Uncharacterized protein n=1 Tax=Physcomitrium patens TaxID=3218 RepID=A0A7I4A3Y2_PHYPA
MTWISFYKTKSMAFEKFKHFQVHIEDEYQKRIKVLQMDMDKEFTSCDFI